MSLTKDQKTMLSEPLDPQFVKSRKAGGDDGVTVSYVEGVHSISEANRIFDFDGWSYKKLSRVLVQEEVKKSSKGKDQWNVGYLVDVEVTVGDIVRQDTGFGNGQNADKGAAHEFAAKEAMTDALKRTLRTFGNTFGLALYDKTKKNVGKKSKTAEELAEERERQAERLEKVKLYGNLLGWYADDITPGDRSKKLTELKREAFAANDTDYVEFMEMKCKEKNLL